MLRAPNPNIFANSPLNRAGHKRTQPAWLKEKLADPASLFVPFWKNNPFILPEVRPGAGQDVGWLPKSALETLITNETPVVFLGINRRDKALFAVDISALPDPGQNTLLKTTGSFEELRILAMQHGLPQTELAILAQAKSMLDWHGRHGFCSVCGKPTHMCEAGYKRTCSHCQTEHFPRTDPVVIMLATHKDKAFMGRQAGFPAGFFSALAGFMEPGESIEEAVARELDEEAKIAVSAVHYHSTQPWPWPSSLMIGCLADAESEAFELDGEELSDGRWFTRDELVQALAGKAPDFRTPPPMAIAHTLVRAFVEGT